MDIGDHGSTGFGTVIGDFEYGLWLVVSDVTVAHGCLEVPWLEQGHAMVRSMLPNAAALAAIGCLEVHRSKLLIGRRLTTWDIICSVEFCQLEPEGFGPYAFAKDFLPIPHE